VKIRVALLALALSARATHADPTSPPDPVPTVAPQPDPNAAPQPVPVLHPEPKIEPYGVADEPDTTKKEKTEIGGLPLVGGDTDNGFGAGAVGNVAHLDPRFTPYAWNLEFEAFYATKSSNLSPSYEDTYLLLTLPQLSKKRLRLEIRPSFTKDSDLRYFGLGNEIHDFNPTNATRDYFTRYHPAMSVNATWKIYAPWYVMGGLQYTFNKVEYAPTSTLAQDMKLAEPFVRQALTSNASGNQSVLRAQAAIIYDTRDNQISPYNGQYHQIEIRDSPRIGDAFPYSYQQLDAQARFYYTPIPRFLTFTARGVFDTQFGSPPFYELTRYEETSAIGGSLGVRGVPAYQFYGKVKAFVNFEAHSETFRTRIKGKSYVLGFAAFVDGGRLWSDLTQAHPELDGTGAGIHWGIGGGVRLIQGRTGVIRGDIAWSPDARPIGLYLIANQIF
jgi:outer membrane protein assembly factor BamA